MEDELEKKSTRQLTIDLNRAVGVLLERTEGLPVWKDDMQRRVSQVEASVSLAKKVLVTLLTGSMLLVAGTVVKLVGG